MTERSREQIVADLERLGSRSKVAKEYGIAPSTLWSRMKAMGIESPHPRARPAGKSAGGGQPAPGGQATGEQRPGSTVRGDKAEIVLPKTSNPPIAHELRDDKQVLRDHRLDPDVWKVRSFTDNWWDGPSQDGQIRYYQSKVVAEKIQTLDDFNIGFEPSWLPPAPRPSRRKFTGPMMVPLFSDPHFPFHEPALYEASLAFLDQFQSQIKELLIPGDEGDWTPFGRHGKNRRPDLDISPNEAIMGVHEGLAGWRQALPNAPIKLLPGNHTHWLQLRLMERYPEAVGMVRPGEDFELLSLRSVVNLDSLHIEFLDTLGQYHDIQYEIAPGLIAMHGTKTGEHGGAVKEIKTWEQASVMQGHDHSGQLTVICKRLPNGYVQRYAVSVMAMCRKDLGYDPRHAVAQGFPVVTVWPDGAFHIDLAFFNPETQETTWRDFRYRP